MLTKSYLDRSDRIRSSPQDRVLYDLFKRVHQQGRITEFVNLQTGERADNGYILQQSDKYAKGLVSLDVLEPGVDSILIIGCYSLEALAVWVACLSIGISVVADIIFMPRELLIEETVILFKPKVVVVGDAADEGIVEAVLNLFQSGTTLPVSEKLSGVKHVYYEGNNTDHLMNYPFMKSLEGLIQQGEVVGDLQLEKVRDKVQPEHTSQVAYSTGTTGQWKSSLHTHKNFLERIGKPVLSSNGAVCITECMNRGSMVPLARFVLNLIGHTDKLVFSPDLSKNTSREKIAQICGDAIIDERVTMVVILPKELDYLCDYMEKSHPKDKQIKQTLLLGQSYTRKFKQKVKDSLGGMTVTCYGLSEIPTVGHTPFGLNESSEEDRMEAKLILSKGCVMRVVDENDCVVDIETEGRIQLKSTYSFKEYHEAEANKDAFTDDGFYKTKDIGMMYPDGKFVILGRESVRKCIYIRRVKLWPVAIEEVIATHKSIRDVKVISSTLTTDTDDEIVYCIRMERGLPNLTRQEVMNHCIEKQMMELEFPRRILFFDDFPQTKNGRKTDFNRLKELVIRRIDENPEDGVIPGSYTQ